MEALDKRDLVQPLKRTRRTFSKQFKAKLVALAESGEQSVSQIAIDHRLNTNQLRKWITEARKPGEPALLPVSVSPVSLDSASGGALEMNAHGILLRFSMGWDPRSVAELITALR